MAVIEGTVASVVFHNDTNGYSVIELCADGGFETAVGILPTVNEGEYLRLTGEYAVVPKYGKQFKFTDFEATVPIDADDIARYLASGLFKGIGQKTAERIVSTFGKNSLDIVENHPELLARIKGISRKKADEINEEFKASSVMRKSVMFLQKFGVSTALAIKICAEYKGDTISIVKENPYRLIEDVDGIGFIKADAIAAEMGIAKNSFFRVKAGILHVLRDAEKDGGHTYVPLETLVSDASRILEIDDDEAVLSAIKELQLHGLITVADKIKTEEPHKAVALKNNFLLENAIAAELVKRIRFAEPAPMNVDEEIELYQKIRGISLHDKQKEAVRNSLNSGCSIISGGPGTGKTTIIKCICSILNGRGMSFSLAAPTGRAAKRMTEATGEEAKTLHRMLGIDFKNGKGCFLYNEHNKMDADVVIVDEISMADVFIFNALLKAVKPESKLILVGDKDQLPSVSAGNILGDLISSKIVPVTFLNFIYRQSEKSLIITNAHKINDGEMPIIDNKSGDFFFDEKSDRTEQVEAVVSMVKERLPKFLGVFPSDIQVLAPSKKGISGVAALNVALQNALNPDGKPLIYGESEFREGDRVMHIKNNYDKTWYNMFGEVDDSGTGVFNGDMGVVDRVVSTRKDNEELVVLTEDGRYIKYVGEDLKELMLSYAVSVHKSQGSEFPAVIIVLNAGSPMLLTKNLLYTAVTRARNAVVIIGDSKVLYRMVKTTSAEKRFTLLPDLIEVNERKLDALC